MSDDGTVFAQFYDRHRPSVSRNGRYVAFATERSLVGDDTNAVTDIYVQDRDADEDGVFDAEERGIPGFPVELVVGFGDSSGTTLAIFGQTDRQGKYEFANLPAGVYRITALAGER